MYDQTATGLNRTLHLETSPVKQSIDPAYTAASAVLATVAGANAPTPRALEKFVRDHGIAAGQPGSSALPGSLLTVEGVSDRTSMSPRKIWEISKRHPEILQRVEIGKSVRFRESDVVKLAQTGLPAATRPVSPKKRIVEVPS